MATAEELLAQASAADDVIVIDNDLRTMTIPESCRLAGVESDDDVHRLQFSMPQTYGEFDLSEFDIRINYLNANNEGDVYVVDDKAANGEAITFSWLMGRPAFAYRGNIRFIVCLKLKDADGTVTQEYNTTVHQLTVLEGLETTEAIVQDNPDILEQILSRIDNLEENGGGGSTAGNDGVGIAKIEKTGTSGLIDTYTITLTDDNTYTFTITNGAKGETGPQGPAGEAGPEGADGGYYTPTITQPTDTTMQVAFAPSQADMPAVEPVTVELPAENTTTGGETINVDAEMKEYMQTVKPAIASAIINKGGTVESTDSFGYYATRISEIPNGIGAAETLPRQTTLVATGLQDTTGILLIWTDVDAAGYLIVRKQDTAPATSADGTIVYNGAYAADGYTDTGVSKGNVYYYRIFPRNAANQCQSLEAGAVAMVDYKDRTGTVLIADLPLGSRIKFGTWNGSDFYWEIIDTLDKNQGFVTVAAEQNLGNRQYDAPETNNTITNRKNQGNNRWAYCAIRQLFNSAEDTGAWWVAQHDYDVAPAYATQIPGFMRDFTDYEKSIVLTKINRCVLDTNDGGGSETVEDKFWSPSSYAMGLEIFQPLEDDHPYEAYTSNEDRTYQSHFWCRTINGTSSASGVRYVYSVGSLNNNTANNNVSVAARPFCLLPTSAYMLWSDSDEAYTFADDSQRNTG